MSVFGIPGNTANHQHTSVRMSCGIFLNLLTSNNLEALKVALEDPPVASKDKNLKVKILWGTVGQIRLCTKSSSNFPGVLP